MPDYSSIHIIYNPNSTGPGKQLAAELQQQLKKALPNMQIDLIATKRAGHAEELTMSIAKKHKLPLIVSVSGDGGYHEVINGAVQAYKTGLKPITALLPAGNANDHASSLQEQELSAAIVSGHARTIDLLKLTAVDGAHSSVRYAHSYIGFGLSPAVGQELTKARLNRITEAMIVCKGLISPRHIVIERAGQRQKLDSLIISNIDRMAKFLTLSQKSSVTDGLFEINVVTHKNRLNLYSFLRRAVMTTASHDHQVVSYKFRTIKPLLVQYDGEVAQLPASAEVNITAEPQLLRCIF